MAATPTRPALPIMRRITRLLEHPKDTTMSYRSGYPLTPTEYAAELARVNRPITDRPIGGHTATKRAFDADASAAFGINEGTIGEPVQRWVADIPCGTPNGYRSHLKAGETACERCRRANAADVAWRKRQRRLHGNEVA